MIKVACHSAVYLPWIGYFYKMSLVDHFVILDNTPIMKGGLGNRNYIVSQGERLRLSVPTKGHSFPRYRDIRLVNDIPWRKKHLRALRQAYAEHPFYGEVGEWLFPVYERDYKFLIDLNFDIIIRIRGYLGLETELRFASDVSHNKYTNATERLLGLTKACGGDTYVSGFGGKDYMEVELFTQQGIGCHIYDFRHPVYSQVGVEEFVPRLTIVDMLFNCGGEESMRIIRENRGKDREGS